jgi:hypothetical protein
MRRPAAFAPSAGRDPAIADHAQSASDEPER